MSLGLSLPLARILSLLIDLFKGKELLHGNNVNGLLSANPAPKRQGALACPIDGGRELLMFRSPREEAPECGIALEHIYLISLHRIQVIIQRQ